METIVETRVIEKSVRILHEYDPEQSFSVCLFGNSGGGKSSMVNALESLPRTNGVRVVAEVRQPGGLNQCTVKYVGYDFNKKVRVFDTWGLETGETESYSLKSFTLMLDGEVKNAVEGCTFRAKTKEQRGIINTVVFVFPPLAMCKEDLEKMKPFYDLAKRKGRRCLVVLTNVDEWARSKMNGFVLRSRVRDPDVAMEEITNSAVWLDEVQKPVTDFLDIEARVIPIVNYKSNDTRKNKVVQFFCEEFVEELTRMVYLIKRNEFKTLPYLFHNEPTETLKYQTRSSDSSSEVPTPVEKLIPEDPFLGGKQSQHETLEFENKWSVKVPVVSKKVVPLRNEFVFPKIFYRSIMMGSSKFRLFACSSMTCPNMYLVGVYRHHVSKDKFNKQTIDYFECKRADEKLLQKLEESFTEKYQGMYEFVSGEVSSSGKYTTTFEMSHSTKYVHLNLHGGGLHLIMLRERGGYPEHAAAIENSIQVLKESKHQEEEEPIDPDPVVTLDPLKEVKRLLEVEMAKAKSEMRKTMKEKNEKMVDVIVEAMSHGEVKYVSADYSTNSSGYIQWNIRENLCGMYYDSSVATYSYRFSPGRYLFVYMSNLASSSNVCIQLYQNGSPIDTSYMSDSHGNSQSPMIINVVTLNDGNYYQFYCNSVSCTSNYDHTLLILRLPDSSPVSWSSPRPTLSGMVDFIQSSPSIGDEDEGEEDEEEEEMFDRLKRNLLPLKTGSLPVWVSSAVYGGVQNSCMLWSFGANEAGVYPSRTQTQFKFRSKGRYLILWKSTLTSNGGSYIQMRFNGSVIDESHGNSCSTSRYSSPCIMKMVDITDELNNYIEFYGTAFYGASGCHTLEVIKIEDGKGLPRFGKKKAMTTSCHYSSRNGKYTLWSINSRKNGCGLHVRNTYQYHLPVGVYVVMWKGHVSGTSTYNRLYLRGSVIARSYECCCGTYLHSPRIVRLVRISSQNDYLQFQSSVNPQGQAKHHSLEIIKLSE